MIAPNCDKLVMIVEDDADVRESIVEVLEDNAYTVLGAANGREALERLRTGEKPCLILLDIMMPIMDGWEFRALQEKDPELSSIPIVVLTAHADVEQAARGMHASGSLRKPVKLDSLLATVDPLCRRN
jgi:CheY-like chemotaxis protein